MIDKRVSDVFLPQTVDISSIKRANKTIVSSAETRFKAGDEIKFIYQKNNKEEIEEYIKDIIN